MKHLYYIRHGESTANVAQVWGGHFDSPLTASGVKQVQAAGQKAHADGLRFDLIISSPLQRAYDTAKLIASATGYPVDAIMQDPRLKERFFGPLEGTPHDPTLIADYWKDETSIDHIKGVETLAAMHDRAQEMLDYLKKQPQDTILIVSHGAIGRMLQRVLRHQPINAQADAYPNAEIFKLI